MVILSTCTIFAKKLKMVKKYLISITLLVVSFTTVFGQTDPNRVRWHEPFDIYVGPKIGVSYSTFTKVGGDPMIWGMVGGFVEVYFTDRLGMNVEMNYSHQGTKNVYHTTSNGEPSGPYLYRMDYINTEYKLKYYFTKPICVFAGFHFGTLINAKAEFEGVSPKQITNIRKQLHRQASVLMGASYETEKWVVDGLYCFPLRRVANKNSHAEEILGNAAQNIFMLTFGWKIKMF